MPTQNDIAVAAQSCLLLGLSEVFRAITKVGAIHELPLLNDPIVKP